MLSSNVDYMKSPLFAESCRASWSQVPSISHCSPEKPLLKELGADETVLCAKRLNSTKHPPDCSRLLDIHSCRCFAFALLNVKICELVMRVRFHDGCLPDNRLEGPEDMLILLLILVQVGLLPVHGHPVHRRHDARWEIPRVVQTKSDRFYLYLPQATIWK